MFYFSPNTARVRRRDFKPVQIKIMLPSRRPHHAVLGSQRVIISENYVSSNTALCSPFLPIELN
jgi:hypothetical protein